MGCIQCCFIKVQELPSFQGAVPPVLVVIIVITMNDDGGNVNGDVDVDVDRDGDRNGGCKVVRMEMAWPWTVNNNKSQRAV